jgi:hypothetical protein
MTSHSHAITAIAVTSVLSAVSADGLAASRCDQLHLTRVEATACAKAAESITALRQYVQRTRMIYNLQMTDFVSAPRQVAGALRGNAEVLARSR